MIDDFSLQNPINYDYSSSSSSSKQASKQAKQAKQASKKAGKQSKQASKQSSKASNSNLTSPLPLQSSKPPSLQCGDGGMRGAFESAAPCAAC